MSDDPNAQGTASAPSWTPPPAEPRRRRRPPPQQDAQAYQAGPGPDPSGGVPQAVQRSGPTISLNPEIVGQILLGVLSFVGVLLGLILKVVDKENTGRADAEGKVQLWDTMGWTWAWLALVAAALMILPAIGSAINLSSQLAERSRRWPPAHCLLVGPVHPPRHRSDDCVSRHARRRCRGRCGLAPPRQGGGRLVSDPPRVTAPIRHRHVAALCVLSLGIPWAASVARVSHRRTGVPRRGDRLSRAGLVQAGFQSGHRRHGRHRARWSSLATVLALESGRSNPSRSS